MARERNGLNLPDAVVAWCREQALGEIRSLEPISGGCINNGARLTTSTGESLFLKQNATAPGDMFAREAEGLEALLDADGPRVPRPFLHGQHFLLLEDLRPAARRSNYWPAFGRQMARLHLKTALQFGFDHDNYIGSTPQPNPWTGDGHAFFRQHRLEHQGRLAQDAGLLASADLARLERLCHRLLQIVPEQPASLIHGDLWSGNAITGSEGEPAIIDPAAHYGWAEAELGMTTLFGSFPESFYEAYQGVRPLEPGWRQRLDVYNLYHLLNHLNLFGAGYLSQVRSLLRRYG